MLKWIDDLYTGPGIEDAMEVIQAVNNGEQEEERYLITLPTNPANLMDFFKADALKNPHVYELCPAIIGVAVSKEEAMELSKQILMECYEKTGGFHIKDFIENR
ncbi:MAG: hypothetical protein KBT01_06260 [Clostridiales bacterium]|nr:hypothetical protein [Candidatus Blautia equi]